VNIEERISAFIESKKFALNSEFKSPYWAQHSSSIKLNAVCSKKPITGSSGDTKPQNRSVKKILVDNKNRLVNLFKNPTNFFRKFIVLFLFKNKPILLSRKNAFNAIMSGHIFVEGHIYYEFSPRHINLDKFIHDEQVYKNCNQLRNTSIFRKGFSINDHLIKAAYYFNIISHNIDRTKVRTIVEIGAGSGILMSLFKDNWGDITLIDVDLPESISHAAQFINKVFPEAKILLPNEINGQNFAEYDFVFLTPEMLDYIKESSIDLTVNTMSFMEMNHSVIRDYINSIQVWSKNGSFLFSSNRVEKIPYSKSTRDSKEIVYANYEFEYPWLAQNENIILETDKLARLTSLDNSMIRLQKINK